MSTSATIKMIGAYIQEAMAPMFLTSFFRVTEDSFHTSEEVEFDVEREGEDIAIVLTDISQGSRHNESTVLTNKRMKPPIYDETGVLTGFELINRQAGESPFEDPDYTANAMRKAFRLFRQMERKIRRSIELMSSQVLQTGKLTLKDKDGNDLYILDFQPNAALFPTVSTTWGDVGADPISDIKALGSELRRRGRVMPSKLIFGKTAIKEFLEDAEVQKLLDTRRMDVGLVSPVSPAPDAVFQGYIWIGDYRFEMWTYDGFYTDPQTGNATDYVATDKVIMLSDQSALQLTFGAIPQIVSADPRLQPFIEAMPQRIANLEGAMDFTTSAEVGSKGRSIEVGIGTRPLTIPKGIDTFGCLTTTAA